ncbi:rho GTPase-activating protein 23-like isoform X3 [Osmerus eperlanus]|uniref:rho GTPase-activating protein 23-like isoform X3 n=1 Tax=Osmerus eperlanus TaxID=29151 RepID=UPI002E11F866
MNGVVFCLVGIPRNTVADVRLRDGMVSSNENVHPQLLGEVEGVSRQGPRTVVLQKSQQGFGFTLRHFILYPPSLQTHKDEENGNGTGKASLRPGLEPMDTIFVKSVRDRGPAQQAGLCTGDRLVKVNGESVLGKTYSQVITLIQNSGNVLELSIMPKDEDVMQLVSAYSQDANLQGIKPYSGRPQNLPEPPPLCYSRSKPTPPIALPTHIPLDNWHCRPVSQAFPLDNCSSTSTLTSGWPGGPEEHKQKNGVQFVSAQNPSYGHNRGRSLSTLSALDFHFANHNAAIASATLPHVLPRKSSLPASRAQADARCHQALSDWYYSQAEAADMSPRHRSISQDRLAELGLALGSASSADQRSWRVSQETIQCHQQAAAPSHNSYWLEGWGMVGPGSRSCSEGLLAAHAEYEHSYGRSVDTLAQAAALVSPHGDQTSAWLSQTGQPDTRAVEVKKQQGLGNQQKNLKTTVTSSMVISATVSAVGRQHQQMAEPQTRRMEGKESVDYKSYSPLCPPKAGHFLQQDHSFREPTYGSHFNWSPCNQTSPSDSELGLVVVPRPQSTPALFSTEDDKLTLEQDREALSPLAFNQEIIFRQKPPSGCRIPIHTLQHPHYAVSVDSAEPPAALSSPVSGGSRPGDSLRKANGNLPPDNSLASIPFIDEATSPNADSACHVPACSLVSSSAQCPSVLASVPTLLTSNMVSPILSNSSPVRLRTRDCSSIKGRRSSYLLAITTERSKSCDEGLNSFWEEGRVFSRLPKRVKSFFTDGSLESLRVAEEVRSKRHSTSELGTITFSNVRKEGWLHYKQILTEKGKKVGGGMRPWKRVFSVLRSHSLFLYKDKREAVLHGAGAGPSHTEDEHPPISIRGCLIDIAYSETKRKHTLRLTTQDFCEYLLQAEDRDDMLGWIRVIRENSKTDNEELGFSRQALISKKLNDYRKQSPTGNKPDASPKTHRRMPPFLLTKTDNTSSHRYSKTDEIKTHWGINIMKKAKKTGNPKVFGVRLEDCQPAHNNTFVPLIVEMCCGMVETMGLEYTGIYRVPGNNAMVSSLQEQLNKGMEIITTEERWQDLNVISSLLKSFFRKLPEPLFTDAKYSNFIDANRLEDAEDRLKTMRKLIHDLPRHYHHTLRFLVGHLKTVADYSDKNKMEPRNLALVFGPTLVRTSEDNMTDMVTHMPDRYKIIETLILHHDWFFNAGALDRDEKAPVDKRDMLPVPNIDHLLSNIGRTGVLGETSVSTTSDSVKSKVSLDIKKDLSARDFLPSLIFTATRKRKKCPSTHQLGSSSGEDSEHEPIKASNYGGEEEKKGKDQEQEHVSEGLNRPRIENNGETEVNKGKKRIEEKQSLFRGSGVTVEREKERPARNIVRRDEGGLSTKIPQPCPNSFLYSHCQSPNIITSTTQMRPQEELTALPLLNVPSLAKACSVFPSWLSHLRLPSLSQASSLQRAPQTQWDQTLPVRYRKKRGIRVRAVSMNLEMELGKDEDGLKSRRGERVELLRSPVKEQCQHGSPVEASQRATVHPVTVPDSTLSALAPGPLLTIGPPSLSHSSAGRTDQDPLYPSTIVLRKTTLEAHKRKAWRRHTVVV